jgi:hypothetical protein
MTYVGRTLIILLAALLVSGGTYALGSAGLIGGPAGRAFAHAGGPPSGAAQGTHGGEGRGGGAAEIGKNLAIIAAIIAFWAAGTALARRVWAAVARRRPQSPGPAA